MQARVIRPETSREYYFEEGCHILELYNSPEDEQVSIARARVEPGNVTRRHALHATVERYLILAGTGEVEIDGVPAGSVGPGDLVLVPAAKDQRIRCTSGSDLVFYAICTPRFRPECYTDREKSV